MAEKFKDSPARSLVKGITWRAIGTLDTFLLAYLLMGSIKMAFPIALTEIFTKILLYFFHERIWNQINWGRNEGHPSHLRSVIKGISYRFWGSLDTFLIGFLYSGNATNALKLGFTEVLTKVGLFYLHERAWSYVKWGRIYKEEKNNAPIISNKIEPAS